MLDYAAFVMTYNRPEILRQTLRDLLSQSWPPSRILVVDNGEGPAAQEVAVALGDAGVGYHCMGENTGPAGASAYGLRSLAEEGYDWIYWVDDDDPPDTSDLLEKLLRLVTQNGNDVGGVGTVGSRFDWRVGELTRFQDAELDGVLDVDMIAGGQQFVLNGEMVRKIGVTEPRIFFALEDLEYCLRIRKAGYQLLVDGPTMLEQRRKHGRLNLQQQKAIVPAVSLQGTWRYYYRVRNYIHMMRNTFDRPDLARREAAKAVARSVTSWRRGASYGSAMTKFQVQGIRDGYADRMGRTVQPTPKY